MDIDITVALKKFVQKFLKKEDGKDYLLVQFYGINRKNTSSIV